MIILGGLLLFLSIQTLFTNITVQTMSFKSKINYDELSQMTQKAYYALLKKDIAKAQKNGQADVVVITDYKFTCGTVAALLLLGKFSGPLARFYKQLKKERKGLNDYAKGTCYFKVSDTNETTLHIALQDGKAKPTKLKKNSKTIFRRLGLLPNIFKGSMDENTPSLSNEEDQQLHETAEDNEDTRLIKIVNQYKRLFKSVHGNILPLLKKENRHQLTNTHLTLARNAYLASLSLKDKYEESNDKQKARHLELIQKAEANQEQLKKIYAVVKNHLEQSSDVKGNNVEQVVEDVKAVVERLRNKAKRALEIINNL